MSGTTIWLRLAILLGATVISSRTAGAEAEAVAGRARPAMKDFIGVCGHTVQFRPELYRAACRLVRDYHPVEWDLGNDPRNYPPFPMARNGVNWDQVYGAWHKSGFDVDACLMFESIPPKQRQALATDAFAYGFCFARAFGPGSPSALVQTVEIGNEPGKFADEAYRNVFENMARGLRAGDPKLRVATCGSIAGKSDDYAKSLACFESFTNLFDVITLHTYAFAQKWPTWRRSFPEDSKLPAYLKDIRDVCAWRDRHAPDKPVWITEFGYDASTRPPEAKGDFKDWVGCTDLQQAQWLVRSWLVFATMPVARAYMYFFNDDDQPRLHAASGLTRHFEAKIAFHATTQLYRNLGDYRFAKIIRDEPERLAIYEFIHETRPDERIWVAWSPTGSGRSTRATLPQPDGDWVRAERMSVSAGSESLDLARAGLAAKPATVELTESPVYLWWKARE